MNGGSCNVTCGKVRCRCQDCYALDNMTRKIAQERSQQRRLKHELQTYNYKKFRAVSHYMTALAMKQAGIKPAAKIVLYWLADHHNGETGRCFPSLKTLERECEMSRPAIIRHLSALEDAGLISRDQRKRDNGSQTSTAYKLHLVPVTKCNTPCNETLQPPVTKRDPLNLGTINLGNEPVLEANASKSLAIAAADDVEKVFAEFWTHYPRKAGKAAAVKAFTKAAKKHSTDDILFGLSQQIEAMRARDPQFIPHAATWLNAERWNDEPEQPTGPDHQAQTYTRGDAKFDEARERALRIGSRPEEQDPIGF